MPAHELPEDRTELEQFREGWERYDNTGDPAHLEDLLAENIVHLSPEGEPIVGKEALLEYLPDVSDRQWEVRSDDLVVSGDLAVERFTIHWIDRLNGDTDPVQGTLKSVDAYERREDGSWKQILSLPLPR